MSHNINDIFMKSNIDDEDMLNCSHESVFHVTQIRKQLTQHTSLHL